MIGDIIKQLRKQHQETQKDLAQAVGSSVPAISAVEKGAKRAGRNLLNKIATHYNTYPQAIIYLSLETVKEEHKAAHNEASELIKEIAGLKLLQPI